MKNLVKYRGYTIVRWITAFIGDDPIGEFDSMAEAKKEFRGVLGITFKYSAAEMINDDGDVNPAVYSVRWQVL